MTDLKSRIMMAAEFDEKRDVVIVSAAVDAYKEIAPGSYTIPNSLAQNHEYGFYAGAKWQREQLRPLIEALASIAKASKDCYEESEANMSDKEIIAYFQMRLGEQIANLERVVGKQNV